MVSCESSLVTVLPFTASSTKAYNSDTMRACDHVDHCNILDLFKSLSKAKQDTDAVHEVAS